MNSFENHAIMFVQLIHYMKNCSKAKLLTIVVEILRQISRQLYAMLYQQL